MLEFHAWITIRETYKVEEEDNYDGIINEIQKKSHLFYLKMMYLCLTY